MSMLWVLRRIRAFAEFLLTIGVETDLRIDCCSLPVPLEIVVLDLRICDFCCVADDDGDGGGDGDGDGGGDGEGGGGDDGHDSGGDGLGLGFRFWVRVTILGFGFRVGLGFLVRGTVAGYV